MTVSANVQHQKQLTAFALKSSYKQLTHRGSIKILVTNFDSFIVVDIIETLGYFKSLGVGKLVLFIVSEGPCY